MLSGKHRDLTLNRLGTFTSQDKSEVNLWSKLFKDSFKRIKPVSLQAYTVQPCPGRISFSEAIKGDFKDVKIGDRFGPSWSTHWFNIRFEIPPDCSNEELHLIWDSESEALLFDENGVPLQGFLGSKGEDRRAEYILKSTTGSVHLYVEMACTAMFGNGTGNGWGGLGPTPTELNKTFELKQVEIAVFDRLAHDLLSTFILIADMAKQLPSDSMRAGQALATANNIINMFDMGDRKTWETCLQLAKSFLASPSSNSHHNIVAVGHCHIDTAWLWPYDETKRKCARSWSTQLRLMEQFPEYKFACSQAQQFAWVKQIYPVLFQQIKEAVKRGQFVPVGGTWVEMDCNIPSGESLVRQFLLGQRFFEQEFGIHCAEFWLPDTFGYSAQLPQIIRGFGMKYFVTQKLSWNQVNKFPHQTFFWEGLDGSRVLTHFPPTDTYNAQANIKDTLFHVTNFKEKERSNHSLMLFGHGDGGGGPLPIHIENLINLRDVDGVAKIQMKSPQELFTTLETEAKDLSVWVGELYFEYHRGTYTSQARNKLNNRKSELLLHDIEFLSSVSAASSSGNSSLNFEYPRDKLNYMWELVLLNQFHDVIPGSSINEVYKDSERHYAEIFSMGSKLLDQSLQFLPAGSETLAFVNTLGWSRSEVVSVSTEQYSVLSNNFGEFHSQPSHDGRYLIPLNSIPSMGYKQFTSADVSQDYSFFLVSAQEIKNSESTQFVLENQFLRATINSLGHVLSLYDKRFSREAIEPGKRANQFVIFEDIPMYWDAWDVDVYHLEKRKTFDGGHAEIIESGPIRAAVKFSVKISDTSYITQIISLDCLSAKLEFDTQVQWQASHQFLKVEFPLNIRSSKATFEVQYGHVERPTHWNTSWDVAKFESCAHKFADLSEYNFGVSLLNDSKYGYAVHGNVMRLSLLRSPKNPDPECDMGLHTFRYAILPHGSTFQAAGIPRQAYNFNVPILVVPSSKSSQHQASFFSVNDANIIIDTVKCAEDDQGVIVRMYESSGGRCNFKLLSPLNVTKASLCDMQERATQALSWNECVSLKANPFEIITIKLELNVPNKQ